MKLDITRNTLLDALQAFALSGNGVIIGRPGAGKTHAIMALRQRLRGKNIPTLFLPVDQLGSGTDEDVSNALQISEDPLKWITKVARSTEQPGVIIIDGFDAARNPDAQSRFLDLIRRIIADVPENFNVLVSVRTYDAKKSQKLLDAFPGRTGSISTDASYQDPTIPCRNFVIPRLTADDLDQAFIQVAHLKDVYDAGSADLKELMHVPFTLWLLERILIDEQKVDDISVARSEVQLLRMFWNRRVLQHHDGLNHEHVLRTIVQKMVQDRVLSIAKATVYDPNLVTVWQQLLSDDILAEKAPGSSAIAFAHNILFDFAVSELLIGDQPSSAVDFVLEDNSRPLFLRPSLSYYFSRLWHETPDQFWAAFWFTLPQDAPHIRLFARLVPTTVICREARSTEELQPILSALKEGEQYANNATKYILHALRTLGVNHENLWASFLLAAADYSDRAFAWDIAIVCDSILNSQDLAHSAEAEALNECGRVARRLFDWTWERLSSNRNETYSFLGAWLVDLISRTYQTDPARSRELLQHVLDLIGDDNFPIAPVYRLANNIGKIAPYDPEFAGVIYSSVYSYHEVSQEKTDFGGSTVLPMSSNRRQDYQMCRYVLDQYFPSFLKIDLVTAAGFAIRYVNDWVVNTEILSILRPGYTLDDYVKARSEEFTLLGSTRKLLPDHSSMWDEFRHNDLHTGFVPQVLTTLVTLAESGDAAGFDELFELYLSGSNVAFLWRRLLQTASNYPVLFADHLFEASLSSTFQACLDTSKQLGDFIMNASSRYSDEQIKQIEQSILDLVNAPAETVELRTRLRDRLLACLPKARLQTDTSKAILSALEAAEQVPKNDPFVISESFWGEYTEAQFLSEQGVDIEKPQNLRLRGFFQDFDVFERDWMNKLPSSEAISEVIPLALEFETLVNEETADPPVQEMAQAKLAACAHAIARGATDPTSAEYDFSRRVLLRAAEIEPNVTSGSDDNSMPGWSPSAATEAAQGIPWLLARRKDAVLTQTLERLLRSPQRAVRFLVASSLFRLIDTSTDEFWSMCELIAKNETNRQVQYALCRTLSIVVTKDIPRTVEVFKTSSDFLLANQAGDDSMEAFTTLVLWLALVQQNEWASGKVAEIANEPNRYADVLRGMVHYATEYIAPQVFVEATKSQSIAHRTISLLIAVLERISTTLKEMVSQAGALDDEQRREQFHDIYGVVDHLILKLYAFADVEPQLRQHRRSVTPVERQSYYNAIKPILDKIVVELTSDGLGFMLAPTAHRLIEMLHGLLPYDPKGVVHLASLVAVAGSRAGYQIDSLAVTECVELVETLLADYKYEMRDPGVLADVLALLDTFANVGWPTALQLVWRLDEVFR